MLDDGRIVLQVDDGRWAAHQCTVQVGGELSDNKGINLKGGGLTAEVLTEKDRADIKTAALIDADYLAVSFPRNADDMIQARKLLEAEGCRRDWWPRSNAPKRSRISRKSSQASEAIMIARGDLGVEIGDANLPAVQKEDYS